jgi:hypothetical protein
VGTIGHARPAALEPSQHVIVKRFLNELLNRNPDEAELQRIWDDTGPNYGFPDHGHLRGFLTLIRDMA